MKTIIFRNIFDEIEFNAYKGKMLSEQMKTETLEEIKNLLPLIEMYFSTILETLPE